MFIGLGPWTVLSLSIDRWVTFYSLDQYIGWSCGWNWFDTFHPC